MELIEEYLQGQCGHPVKIPCLVRYKDYNGVVDEFTYHECKYCGKVFPSIRFGGGN